MYAPKVIRLNEDVVAVAEVGNTEGGGAGDTDVLVGPLTGGIAFCPAACESAASEAPEDGWDIASARGLAVGEGRIGAVNAAVRLDGTVAA